MIEAETGECWFLPRKPVFDSYEAHYGKREDYSPNEADDGTLIDWLQNNMDWKDFAFYLQEMPRLREHNPEEEWPNMEVYGHTK